MKRRSTLVTELAAAEARIARLEVELRLARRDGVTDELTGVLNRRGIMAALAAEMTSPTIDRPRLVVIDADKFKAVNDTRGHDTGDFLLIAIARVLRARFGPAAVVGRLGGDEFVVVTSGPLVDAIVGLTAVTEAADGTEVIVSLSAGVAELGGRRDLRVALREADLALLRAKRDDAGVAVYDPALDGPAEIVERPTTRIRDRHVAPTEVAA
jgi:diguanylate cyclase (GGDEF)-like protein